MAKLRGVLAGLLCLLAGLVACSPVVAPSVPAPSVAPVPRGVPTVSELWLTNGARRIYGQLYLPGDGRPTHATVILAHGYGGTHATLRDDAQRLSAAGYAAFIFDFPGGGEQSRSSGAMADMTVQSEIDDLAAIVDQIKELPQVDPGHLFLFGESQGGLVSAVVAARRPERVRGLVLLFPAFNIPDAARAWPARTSDLRDLKFSAAYLAQAATMDAYRLIAPYRGPVLILHGDRDTLVPLSASQRALEAYASARLTVIPGAGHGFAGADADRVRRESLDFLGKQR